MFNTCLRLRYQARSDMQDRLTAKAAPSKISKLVLEPGLLGTSLVWCFYFLLSPFLGRSQEMRGNDSYHLFLEVRNPPTSHWAFFCFRVCRSKSSKTCQRAQKNTPKRPFSKTKDANKRVFGSNKPAHSQFMSFGRSFRGSVHWFESDLRSRP